MQRALNQTFSAVGFEKQQVCNCVDCTRVTLNFLSSILTSNLYLLLDILGSVVKDSFCHTCVSNSSMADCIESQTQEQCSLKENRCGIMFARQGEISLFRKGCIPDDFCSSLCQNGHIEGDPSIECELHCCEGSLCNDENMGAKWISWERQALNKFRGC